MVLGYDVFARGFIHGQLAAELGEFSQGFYSMLRPIGVLVIFGVKQVPGVVVVQPP
jgi:hypothetical protein